MWDYRPSQRQIVGELDRLEEMDVFLSVRELREFLSGAGDLHAAKLLSGYYLLEPWIRLRQDQDGDWQMAYGIEVTRDDDEA